MATLTGSVRVHTFKEGVLSRVAHDLRLSFGVFRAGVAAGRVSAEIELESLRVDGVMRGGVLHPEELSPDQRREIERAAREEVLGTARHALARFEGAAAEEEPRAVIEGELELRGRRAPLRFEATRAEGVYRARFPLVPSRFGVAQYRALLGAIRLRDHVEVELELALSLAGG